MKKLVCDTDFLSSFLKIGRLKLVLDFYGTLEVTIPPAVYGEISRSRLAVPLVSSHELSVENPDSNRVEELKDRFPTIGPGEVECLALVFEEDFLSILAVSFNPHFSSFLNLPP